MVGFIFVLIQILENRPRSAAYVLDSYWSVRLIRIYGEYDLGLRSYEILQSKVVVNEHHDSELK